MAINTFILDVDGTCVGIKSIWFNEKNKELPERIAKRFTPDFIAKDFFEVKEIVEKLF